MRGITVGLSPVIDLIRDPRWGRNEEFFGEDPYHVSIMGLAAVRGLQGPARPIGADRIFATLKHYVHGTPQGGINVAPADMSERTLRAVYLPSFAKGINDGHAAIIMPSYNEVAGVPAHANKPLLEETGRGLLGFQGVYMSDYNAIDRLVSDHHVAGDKKEAAVLAMKAGVDIDLPDSACYVNLPDLVRAGRVPVESVDAAVARVLALKFEAGLFENPYVDEKRAARVLADPAGAGLARKAAQKALVLLKNDGILPLDPAKPTKIALIGPNSVVPRLGGYSRAPERDVGIFDGLKAAGAWLAQQSKILRPETAPMRPVPPAENQARIAQAVEVAKRSDIILLVVGDNEQITRESVISALPGDRRALGLFGDQDALVDALLETGKPIVALLINGRPLAVTKLAEKANALVEGWYLGEQGGHAVADMLFGRTNPGGKLSVSFPGSAGDLPVWYDRHPSADLYPYVEGKALPLFPFGHGLSYTSFELSAPRLSADRIAPDGKVQVEVDVANTGSRDGDEVVQIYIRDEQSSVPRPVKELKGFRRVTLKKGEQTTMRFELGPDELGFWDMDMKWSVEPGTFRISAGNSSAALKHTTLTIA
jgi:beta-glucosidase